ncbi:MAG: hypothetical protein D6693_00175 [Planctomycetota bacterium]|nr:MAG: hypothetical protein D6693_00175 [Planctomycetota bacterium]
MTARPSSSRAVTVAGAGPSLSPISTTASGSPANATARSVAGLASSPVATGASPDRPAAHPPITSPAAAALNTRRHPADGADTPRPIPGA